MIVYDRQSTDTMHDHRFVCSICGQRSETFRGGWASRFFEPVEFVRQADRMGWLFVIPGVKATDPVNGQHSYIEFSASCEQLYEGRSFCPVCRNKPAATQLAAEVYLQSYPTRWERLLHEVT